MATKLVLLVLGTLATLTLADVKFSRTVSDVKTGFSGSASLDSGCTSKDAYGSNNCDIKWGDSHTLTIAGNFPEDLNSAAKIKVSLKVDHIFPWDFTCNVCGTPCTVTIPVVKKTITVKLPPCPIAKGALSKSVKFTLPSKCPVPISIVASGSATVTDDSGATVAKIAASATVGPPSDAVTPVMEYQTAATQLPEMIVDVMSGLLGANVTLA